MILTLWWAPWRGSWDDLDRSPWLWWDRMQSAALGSQRARHWRIQKCLTLWLWTSPRWNRSSRSLWSACLSHQWWLWSWDLVSIPWVFSLQGSFPPCATARGWKGHRLLRRLLAWHQRWLLGRKTVHPIQDSGLPVWLLSSACRSALWSWERLPWLRSLRDLVIPLRRCA